MVFYGQARSLPPRAGAGQLPAAKAGAACPDSAPARSRSLGQLVPSPGTGGSCFPGYQGCGSPHTAQDGGNRGHSDKSPPAQQGWRGWHPAASPGRIPTRNATNVSLIYFSRQSRGFDTSLLVIWHSSGMYTFWDRCDINNGLGPGKQEALQEDGAKLLTVMDFQER